jgi:hypothetical protein
MGREREREKKEKKPTKPNVRTNICSDPLLVFPPFPPTGLRYSAVETPDPIRESPVDGHPLDVVDRGFLLDVTWSRIFPYRGLDRKSRYERYSWKVRAMDGEVQARYNRRFEIYTGRDDPCEIILPEVGRHG